MNWSRAIYTGHGIPTFDSMELAEKAGFRYHEKSREYPDMNVVVRHRMTDAGFVAELAYAKI